MADSGVLTYIVAPDKIENYYEVTANIGKGGFGAVQSCKRVRRPILHHLVLKTVDKEERFKSCVLRPDKNAYQAALLQFDHENVVHYYDFLEDDLHAYVVMPQCIGGSLWSYLNEADSISELMAQGLMRQILRALSYIHSLGICHRDVTPQNLFFETPACETLKLIDFGLCALDQKPNEPGSIIGTLLFIAPEVFSGFYSEALDVWAAGIILHVMLACRYPFNGNTGETLLASMAAGLDLSGHPWKHVSSACRDILLRMLDIAPETRITAAESLTHEWFLAPRSDKALQRRGAAQFAQDLMSDAVRFDKNSAPELDLDLLLGHIEAYEELPTSRQTAPVQRGALAAPLLRRVVTGYDNATKVKVNKLLSPAAARAADRTNQSCQIITQGRLIAGMATQTTGRVSGFVPPLLRKASFRDARVTEVLPDTTLSSEWDGTVATFSINVGASLLSTPFAFAQVGMVAIPLQIFFTFCSGYTAHLMAWALDSQASKANTLGIPRQGRDWSFLADAAFGVAAKRLLTAFLIFELWGYVVSYTVVVAVHMNLLAEQISKTNAVFISSAITLLLCFVSQDFLTRVSLVCNGIFFLVCGAFVATGFLLPEQASSSEFVMVDPPEIMAAAGILVFSSASHACYPSIMNSLAEPRRYTSSLRQSYCGQLIFYLALCVPGYFCFGKALQQSLVENIGKDRNMVPIPGLGWMGPAAAAGMVLKVSAMQPLVFTPLVHTLTCLLPQVPEVVMMLLALAVSAICSALFADKMAVLINLIGSVLCMNIAFVMPVACYWRLCGQSSSLLQKLGFAALITMGCTFAVLGLLSALGLA